MAALTALKLESHKCVVYMPSGKEISCSVTVSTYLNAHNIKVWLSQLLDFRDFGTLHYTTCKQFAIFSITKSIVRECKWEAITLSLYLRWSTNLIYIHPEKAFKFFNFRIWLLVTNYWALYVKRKGLLNLNILVSSIHITKMER